MAQKNILIVTGEPSGDLQAAGLVACLKQLSPELNFLAVGGPCLKEAGAEIIYDIKGLTALGFFDVLKKLPRFFALRKFLLEKIASHKPAAVILVDFPGFNLRLAKAINKKIPVIYYISPQVWASRRGRIKTIKKYVDKIIVFFKFEEELYKKYGVNAECVGHPLLDIVRPGLDKFGFFEKYQLLPNRPLFTLLPGSRRSEIEKILPLMLKTANLIDKNLGNCQFIVAKSAAVDWALYNRLVSGAGIELKVIEGKTYDCIKASEFALVASGSATLETAILEKPFLVIYKMSLLNYLLYRPQVKVPFIAMANIVAGRKIVPEFIQFQARPEKIAKAALQIIKNQSTYNQMQNDLAALKSLLGQKGATFGAAQIVQDFLNENKPQ